MERIEAAWLAEGRKRVFGIPLFFGKDETGRPFLQRLAFTSVFSERVHAFVRDPRFAPILDLVGDGARVGDREKDGVVFNRYLNVPGSVYPRLGWHTDGLRDLFYGRMPQEMLNIGLHLDRCRRENGGLRLIPGSHRQGFWSMCFRKPYFVSHGEDPAEVCVETEPGDLTVHDGRLWHRVARSTLGKGQPASLDVPALPDRSVRAEERRQPHAGVPPTRGVGARLASNAGDGRDMRPPVQRRRFGRRMRNSTLAAMALMITVARHRGVWAQAAAAAVGGAAVDRS